MYYAVTKKMLEMVWGQSTWLQSIQKCQVGVSNHALPPGVGLKSDLSMKFQWLPIRPSFGEIPAIDVEPALILSSVSGGDNISDGQHTEGNLQRHTGVSRCFDCCFGPGLLFEGGMKSIGWIHGFRSGDHWRDLGPDMTTTREFHRSLNFIEATHLTMENIFGSFGGDKLRKG